MPFLLDPELPYTLVIFIDREFVGADFGNLHAHAHSALICSLVYRKAPAPRSIAPGPPPARPPAQSSTPLPPKPSPPAGTSVAPALCRSAVAIAACRPSR